MLTPSKEIKEALKIIREIESLGGQSPLTDSQNWSTSIYNTVTAIPGSLAVSAVSAATGIKLTTKEDLIAKQLVEFKKISSKVPNIIDDIKNYLQSIKEKEKEDQSILEALNIYNQLKAASSKLNVDTAHKDNTITGAINNGYSRRIASAVSNLPSQIQAQVSAYLRNSEIAKLKKSFSHAAEKAFGNDAKFSSVHEQEKNLSNITIKSLAEENNTIIKKLRYIANKPLKENMYFYEPIQLTENLDNLKDQSAKYQDQLRLCLYYQDKPQDLTRALESLSITGKAIADDIEKIIKELKPGNIDAFMNLKNEQHQELIEIRRQVLQEINYNYAELEPIVTKSQVNQDPIFKSIDIIINGLCMDLATKYSILAKKDKSKAKLKSKPNAIQWSLAKKNSNMNSEQDYQQIQTATDSLSSLQQNYTQELVAYQKNPNATHLKNLTTILTDIKDALIILENKGKNIDLTNPTLTTTLQAVKTKILELKVASRKFGNNNAG